MREYEITYLVQNEDVYKNKLVEKTIEKLEGKIVSSKPWGQKNLVYTIKKLNTAFIVTDVFEIDGQNLPKLDRQLRLKPEIIRFLIVKDVKEVPNLGEETDTRPRTDEQYRKKQFAKPAVAPTPREPKVIITEPKKTEKVASVEKVASPKVKKAIEAITKETPKKTEKLIKKMPAKKTSKPESAPSDEERLKQLESKLQDLLKE